MVLEMEGKREADRVEENNCFGLVSCVRSFLS